MNEIELTQAIAKAITESNAQFTLMDLASIAGGVLLLGIMAFRYIYIPYKQGLIKPVTPEDLVPRQEAEKAFNLVNDIYHEVKQGNSVILQKDGDGQISLLNIPRWLREMVSSQQRTEEHIGKMVNHQSDVLTAISEIIMTHSKTTQDLQDALKEAIQKLKSQS